MRSNPKKADSDDDGLLDGKKQEYNGITLVPRDPEPLKKNGTCALWEARISEIQNDVNTAYHYSNDYYDPVELEGEWEKFWGIIPYWDGNTKEVFLSVLTSLGSHGCDFRYDDEHIALHSDTTQWQKIAGYNNFYDFVFETVTSADALPLAFALDGQDYIVWAWKANYLNLGAGAEVGFYEEFFDINDKQHWIVNKEFPMAVSLYRKTGDSYTNYFHWLYDGPQWWGTGFTGIIDGSVKKDDLIQVSYVDFSSEPEMLKALRKAWVNSVNSEYLIFDFEDNKLWIMW